MYKKDSSGAPNPDQTRVKCEAETRSSPDSSTDRWGCPQCGEGHPNESLLIEHLANDHQIRVVSPAPPPGSALTRCPVCRKYVPDLSHHFALDHGNDNGAVKSLSVGAASVTRIIPIVLPSKQADAISSFANSVPKYSSSRPGDVTIIPMPSKSNFTNDERSNDSNDNPMNLTVTKKANSSAAEDSGSETASLYGVSQLDRKRRKQTHVPEQSKDEKYWARRLKNNEAAKKSRDMRIKREKVIFEDNVRLESMVKELKAENDILTTENKELHLKMGIILDENERLKSLLGRDRNES